MKILFVCKNNRFRSRVAESYFNSVNENKKVFADSAGIIVGAPLTKYQSNVARKAGLRIDGRPRGLSSKLILSRDLIVIVADNVPSSIFKDRSYSVNVVKWGIKDVYVKDEKKILKTIEEIKSKVRSLVKKLEKKER